MLEAHAARKSLEIRLTFMNWSVGALALLAVMVAVLAMPEAGSLRAPASLASWGALGLIVFGAIFARHRANARLETYCTADQDLASALRSSSSKDIECLRKRVREQAGRDRAIQALYSERAPSIGRHLEEVLEAESLAARRSSVYARCADARNALRRRLEQQRFASPVIEAERTITGAIETLERHKAEAERDLDEQRERRTLKWWFDLTRPGFEEVDAKIEELGAARKRLIASGDIAKTEEHYRALTALVDRRTAEIERAALSAIPARRDESFDEQRVVQNALLLSALSVPVSAWRDIGQAGDVYDSLREVNGNYADMSDADIWLDTLTMPGAELAGLANLTKGALFEKYVEADFGGERFANFNHPDTDIIIDGEAIQIKATDSVSYINSVPDHIPVVSTSEVADLTGSIDGGYANEELTNAVDLAFGGTLVDIGDTALDAVLSGVGGVGIFAILRGVQGASAKYKESGDALQSLAEGVSTTAVSTARSAVNMAEIATRGTLGVVTSKPMRLAGGLIASGARRFDQWIEKAEDEQPSSSNAFPARPGASRHR